MATPNRTDLNLEPEARIAVLLVRERGLSPPVAIDELVNDYADVEVGTFPGKWDALLVQKEGGRARVVLSDHLIPNSNRWRFTLAHELGHLVIPWSLGTVFCHATVTYHISDDLLRSIEAEANRFASELLLPREWLVEKLSRRKEPLARFVWQTSREARVSPIVSSIATAAASPPGTIVMIVDEAGVISYSARAPGSIAKAPTRWTSEIEEHLERSGARVSRAAYGGESSLVVVEFDTSADPGEQSAEKGSTAILEEIISSLRGSSKLSSNPLHIVTGLVGSANRAVMVATGPRDIEGGLRQAFANHPELGSLVVHPNFNDFIRVRSMELFARRAQ